MPLTRINGTQIAENSITAEDIVYSLDDAYDNGGSGVGRTITADAGAVIIDGNASSIALEVTGNIRATGAVTAGVLATTTTTTFNLLNTALTGTLNVGGAATLLNFGSATSTGSFGGDLGVTGRAGLGGVLERMTHTQGGNFLACDMIGQSIFYMSSPSGNVTASFTNVPTATNRVHTPTVILSQSATGRIVSAVQIGSIGQTILWANGITPTGNANKQDVFGFSLIRSGSIWTVLGQMSTFG